MCCRQEEYKIKYELIRMFSISMISTLKNPIIVKSLPRSPLLGMISLRTTILITVIPNTCKLNKYIITHNYEPHFTLPSRNQSLRYNSTINKYGINNLNNMITLLRTSPLKNRPLTTPPPKKSIINNPPLKTAPLRTLPIGTSSNFSTRQTRSNKSWCIHLLERTLLKTTRYLTHIITLVVCVGVSVGPTL